MFSIKDKFLKKLNCGTILFEGVLFSYITKIKSAVQIIFVFEIRVD